jgi:hypothetical protein
MKRVKLLGAALIAVAAHIGLAASAGSGRRGLDLTGSAGERHRVAGTGKLQLLNAAFKPVSCTKGKALAKPPLRTKEPSRWNSKAAKPTSAA